MKVAVFQNLVTRDGRRAVEVRYAQELGEGYYASPKATLYSCAYDPLGAAVALSRALNFCTESEHEVVHIASYKDSRAAWQ